MARRLADVLVLREGPSTRRSFLRGVSGALGGLGATLAARRVGKDGPTRSTPQPTSLPPPRGVPFESLPAYDRERLARLFDYVPGDPRENDPARWRFAPERGVMVGRNDSVDGLALVKLDDEWGWLDDRQDDPRVRGIRAGRR